MQPDEPTPGTPQHWLARAAGHLAFARQAKPSLAFWEDLAFHAQQAAELAIKAVYQQHGLPFHFTHDIADLGTGLEEGGIAVPDSLKDAAVLTRYAVQARYPGASPPVTEEEHKEAVRLASLVVAWAKEVVEARTGGAAEDCGTVGT